jgi:HTH-type transcriptional regulator/antitoxin HigA
MSATLLKTGYADLIERFPLKAIASDAEYGRAAAIVDELAVRGERNLDRGERAYLDTLAILMDAYDAARLRILSDEQTGTLVQRLRKLLSLSGLTSADAGDIIGSRPAFSMALAGKRELSKEHIRRLAEHFRISTDYLLV